MTLSEHLYLQFIQKHFARELYVEVNSAEFTLLAKRALDTAEIFERERFERTPQLGRPFPKP